MAKRIMPGNARTQCIELAVEELSKRDSVTMTDVREYMDDLVSQKIPTGEKAKYKDPNGEEHECDLMEPISKFYTYKSDEKEILNRTEENILNNHDFTLGIQSNVKLSNWLKDLKARSFFVAKEDIPEFIHWGIRVAKDIQNTCKNGDVARTGDAQKLQLQFNSVVKGCGKSTFIRQLVDGASKLGIRARDEVQMPEARRFGTTDAEARYLILGYKEHVNQKLDDSVLMAVGRRESYTLEEKGLMPKSLQARAITIGSSNGFPYNKDDRTMTVIRCNSLKFQQYPESIQKDAVNGNLENSMFFQLNTQFSWISGFLDDLLSQKKVSCKKEVSTAQNLENQEKERNLLQVLKRYEISRLLLDVFSAITSKELLAKVSVANLSKLYKHATGTELTFNQKNKIAELLTILYSKGLISKLNYETNDLYKAYNLFEISSIRLEDLSEEGEVTALQEVEMAQAEWDRIIRLAEAYESNDPDNDPSKETFLHEEAQEANFPGNFIYKKTEYSNPTVQHGEDIQFIVSNPVKLEYVKAVEEGKLDPDSLARGDYLESTNFVFECDDTSIEEQKQMIENLPEDVKKSIISVTSSGADSVHVLLETTCHVKEARKAVWKYLSDTYFGGKADQQCSNNSRLTPNPNAIRNRKLAEKPQFVGKKQTCYYFNRNPEPLYVDNIVLKEKAEQEAQKKRYEECFNRRNISFKKQELTVDVLKARKQTPARDYAIQLLEGTIEHGPDAISGLKYLLSTGFDEADLYQNIPLMTWKEKEFQGMIDFAKKGL